MFKKLSYAALAVVVLLLVIAIYFIAPYYFRVKHFAANPGKGYHADFYLYVSPTAKDAIKRGNPALLLIQPNNSGINSDDPATHLDDAWWTGFGRHFLADELGVILLVPAFIRPAQDWHIYTHALDRDVLTTQRTDLRRLDLQLLNMIEHARAVLNHAGIPTHPKILIQGFSASGMFANRFTALHPGRVLAVAAGSPGGWPIAPISVYNNTALPYPIGIADIETLTGEPFDSTAYREVHQLLVMGSRDDNDSVDFRDGWDEDAAAVVDRLFGPDPLSRWSAAEAIYRASGANVDFLLIEGVGHDRRKLQQYTTTFFKKIIALQDGKSHP